MTTLTLCYDRGQFIVARPDIEPRKFKSRREAKDWCADHHPAPIKETGADGVKRTVTPARRQNERVPLTSGQSHSNFAVSVLDDEMTVRMLAFELLLPPPRFSTRRVCAF